MERDLNYFWKNCIERNLCKEYVLMWRNCKTKKDFIDLSLKLGSIPYIATSIYNGWGISEKYICSEFSEYINGKYIGIDVECFNKINKINKDNKEEIEIKSVLYCSNKEDINFKENIIHIIDCDCDLYVPFNEIKIICISNKSNIRLNLLECGTTTIYLFDESIVTIEKDTEFTLTQFYKYSDNCKIIKNDTVGKYLFKRKDLKI